MATDGKVFIGEILVNLCGENHNGERCPVFRLAQSARSDDYRVFACEVESAIRVLDKNPDTIPLAMDLRHRVGLLTEAEMADKAISVQDASNIRAVARLLVTITDSLTFEGLSPRSHPALYLVMDKIASMGAYHHYFEGTSFSTSEKSCRLLAAPIVAKRKLLEGNG